MLRITGLEPPKTYQIDLKQITQLIKNKGKYISHWKELCCCFKIKFVIGQLHNISKF